MSDYVNIISQVGFPIAITIFLLIERNKSTKELTKAINELIIVVKSKGGNYGRRRK